MVHSNLCFRNLSSQSLHCISVTKDWSCHEWFWRYIFWIFGCYSFQILSSFIYLESEDGPELPTKVNEEFRPFIRRLPEFKFWYSVSKSTVIAVFCTFFEVFNIPVFWPILVMYFITLFCLTMKRQIKVNTWFHFLPVPFIDFRTFAL